MESFLCHFILSLPATLCCLNPRNWMSIGQPHVSPQMFGILLTSTKSFSLWVLGWKFYLALNSSLPPFLPFWAWNLALLPLIWPFNSESDALGVCIFSLRLCTCQWCHVCLHQFEYSCHSFLNVLAFASLNAFLIISLS